MSALDKLKNKTNKTELELCVVMAGSLCNAETAAEELSGLKARVDFLETQLCNAQNYIKEIEKNYDALQSPMPCGHPARYANTTDEGTSFCVMCELQEANVFLLP